MRVTVIGGSGHIGTYLTPRLVEAGYEVVCVSRGQRQPYQPHGAWRKVEQVVIDRPSEEADVAFGRKIAEIGADAVIDLTCFTLESAQQMVAALRGRVGHFLHCGTIWVHGPSVVVPTTEAQPRRPFGDYGLRKAAIEDYLLREARRNGFPATILHPGHMVGPGWTPLNPTGNFDPEIYFRLADGREVVLPNIGRETVHHVHADDVAQAFEKALGCRAAALGESFHVVSPAAVTLLGYAETVASWFGREANLKFLGWEEWRYTVSEADA
ncbi:MAG TPA: NAD-dependent epimerase/dehydratase family protein, partial [Bryobacteraceae bacterium]|nr:NAD-dependent epimerase/dehydratase family protein [Bryobacteraceae bacterium]